MGNAAEQARRDVGNGLKPRQDVPAGQKAEYDKAYEQAQKQNQQKK